MLRRRFLESFYIYPENVLMLSESYHIRKGYFGESNIVLNAFALKAGVGR